MTESSPQSSIRRYLITGATSGIGRATAVVLAKRKARLVVVGRSEDALQSLEKELLHAGSPEVIAHRSDLSVVANMNSLAHALCEGPPLDGMMLGAGVLELQRKLTVDGFELNYAVNHLHKFVLVRALGQTLAQRGARVVVGAPVGRVSGTLDDVHGEKAWSMFHGVATSQWANDVLALELSQRLGPQGLHTVAWNPGSTRGTQIARSLPLWARGLFWMVNLAGRPLHEVGAQGADLLEHAHPEALSWVSGRKCVPCPLKDDVTPGSVWATDAKMLLEACP